MLDIVITVVADIFQAYCYYLIFRCFFDRCKLSGKGELAAYFVLMLFISLPHILINRAVVTGIMTLSACMWIVFIYEGSVKKKILSSVFAVVFVGLIESIVAAVFGYIHLDFLAREEYFSLLALVCLPFAEYLLIQIMRNFKNIKTGQELPALYWGISIALPVFSAVLYTLFYKQVNWSKMELVVFIVILFIINIFVFFLYDKQIDYFRVKHEKETLELQNEYQLHQLQLMNELGQSARQQRHDFIKHISMISYMCKEGKLNEMENYIGEVSANVESRQRYATSGNFVIDSILNYKIQEATDKGIYLETDLCVPKEQEFSAYDMNVLLSNLIDNAMEAVQDLTDKHISVRITFRHHKLYITVVNPYEELRCEEEGVFATTKQDKENHGFGLNIIREIIKKYEGKMDIDTLNGVFDVQICLLL
jgi:hypothetical protein